MQALLVPLHGDWYAIELTRVREVVAAPEPTLLPGAPPAVAGVFNLRGDVLPLFDTALLLGLPSGEPADRIAVADASDGPAGLIMHGRPDRIELGEVAGQARRPGAISRHAASDERVVTLLDVDELIAQAWR